MSVDWTSDEELEKARKRGEEEGWAHVQALRGGTVSEPISAATGIDRAIAEQNERQRQAEWKSEHPGVRAPWERPTAWLFGEGGSIPSVFGKTLSWGTPGQVTQKPAVLRGFDDWYVRQFGQPTPWVQEQARQAVGMSRREAGMPQPPATPPQMRPGQRRVVDALLAYLPEEIRNRIPPRPGQPVIPPTGPQQTPAPAPTPTPPAPPTLWQLAQRYGYATTPEVQIPENTLPPAGPGAPPPRTTMPGVQPPPGGQMEQWQGEGRASAAAPAGRSIIDALLEASGEDIGQLRRGVAESPQERAARDLYERDIGYLRGQPYTSSQEQAMVEAAKSRIRTTYATSRQRLIDEMGAQQGNSGPLREMLMRLDAEEAQALNAVDRGLLAQESQEYRSRLGESRGLADVLSGLGRTREELELQRRGQSRDILAGLEALERARQMEALGVEQALDEADLRNVLALMQALGMAPSAGDIGNLSGNILAYAQNALKNASAQQAANQQGLSSLLQWYFMRPQPAG